MYLNSVSVILYGIKSNTLFSVYDVCVCIHIYIYIFKTSLIISSVLPMVKVSLLCVFFYLCIFRCRFQIYNRFSAATCSFRVMKG